MDSLVPNRLVDRFMKYARVLSPTLGEAEFQKLLLEELSALGISAESDGSGRKEVIDEVIFRTTKPRNRLMLELMARGGMRISEVLKLTPADIEDRRLILRDPKSGKEREVVFIPQKVADRLKEYIGTKKINPDQRIFSISYTAARVVVNKAGKVVGIHLGPHDLRRHAATYASRSGVPIEIVSKVILRHANLSTIQQYLGTVSDMEAIKWSDNLYG